MTQYQELEYLLENINQTLFCLFQSGFDTVHDTTLEALHQFSQLAMDYSLTFAAETLDKLWKNLSLSRSQFKKEHRKNIELYIQLKQYANICLERLMMIQIKEELNHEGTETIRDKFPS